MGCRLAFTPCQTVIRHGNCGLFSTRARGDGCGYLQISSCLIPNYKGGSIPTNVINPPFPSSLGSIDRQACDYGSIRCIDTIHDLGTESRSVELN